MKPCPAIALLRAAAVVLALSLAPGALAGEVLTKAPLRPISTAYYLFYLHGAYVERSGTDDRYQYREILETLAARDFTVIGEVRKPGGLGLYARELAAQVRHLLAAGVPSWHIAVAGHSRGGFIALLTAAELGLRDIKYGILAACGREGTTFRRPYDRFLERSAGAMQGRFLVMWDENDTEAGDCDKAMAPAKVKYDNRVLASGEGHRIYYKPDNRWIDPLVAFLRAR